jgi:hypothetical protein
MARLRRGAIAAIVGSLTLTAAAPAHADEPVRDTTPPVISSTGLTPGQAVSPIYNLFPIFSDNVGIQMIEVLINGTVCSTTRINPMANSAPRLIATGLPDGAELDVTVRVTDTAGNSSEATTHVRLDKIAPTGTITPARGTAMPSGPVTITFAGLPADIRDVTMGDGTGKEGAVRTEAPWTFTWDATEQAGSPGFWLRDQAGNRTGLTSGYLVDDTAPVIDNITYDALGLPAQTLRPGTGTVIGAEASLDATVTDKTALSRVEWWVNGTLRADRYPHLDLTPAMTTGNTATIELRVWDALGHPATATFPLTIDRTGPTITTFTPANGTLVRNGAVRTTITATDPHGVDSVGVVGGIPDMDGAPNTYWVQTYHDGPFTVTGVAVDRLGNSSSVRRTVIVDNTKPKVGISKAPKNGAKVTKTTTITATASDLNRIARVQLLVNGKVVGTDTSAGYRFTLNPKKYGKRFTIQLRAYDRAGNLQYSGKRAYHR